MSNARLNAEIDELALLSSHPAPAVTRVLFSPEDFAARAWLVARAEQAGFQTRTDAIGNLFITWPGTDPTLAPVATGSHTDAIPNAGKYDGVVGVLGGLEAMRTLRESGHVPKRGLELIMFTAEEPTRFGIGCLGSRMLAGTMSPNEAKTLRDPEGMSLDDLRPTSASLETVPLNRSHYSAFVELHIEQGPLLDAEGLDIGIVEKIAAPAAFRLILEGTGGHAGAVLMPERHDAFLAAAEIALAVERAALHSGSPDTVGTTGRVVVIPGAINSIPNHTLLEIDFRDTNLDTRDRALAEIRFAAEEICQRRGVLLRWEQINADPPALCDPSLIRLIETSCESLGYTCRRMISRAYHDALFMARLCPTAMIFIPCHKGYSHRPDEYSSPEAIAKGTALLAETLCQLSAV